MGFQKHVLILILARLTFSSNQAKYVKFFQKKKTKFIERDHKKKEKT